MKKRLSYTLIIYVFILFSCSRGDNTIVANNNQKTTISVSTNSISFSADASKKSFSITTESTTSWSISGADNWFSLSETSGTGNKIIEINTDTNFYVDELTKTITVSTSTESEEIVLTQNGANISHIPNDSSNMNSFKSVELTKELGVGWNLGNSLEAIPNETAWGNPAVTKELIDGIKSAGFNTIRIPVAWSSHFSDTNNYTIDTAWMERVETVVNYILDNDMFVIMNIHWDGGWMQPTYQDQDTVNKRLKIMWYQIAEYFRDYDYRLIFAGTNEVMVDGDYSAPKEEYYTVQNSFNNTFINAVRATGGRNAYRYLAIQGFNTNIDHAVNFMSIPSDTVENRLFVEVHYYDPFNFTLNETSDTIWQWGKNSTDTNAVEDWANEAYVDKQFKKMQTSFHLLGIGVILGEYGAISRSNIPNHYNFRENYFKYVTKSALNHKLAPIYWDNGYTSNHAFGLFNRSTGEEVYPDLIDALTEN